MKPFEEKASADIVGENVAKLKTIFPEAFSEGKLDFEVLKQVLGGMVDEREEKYGLNWHGKRRARQLALTPSTGTLRPCPQDSVDWDNTKNLMIEGDNLEVLKLLQKSYSGKVKLIYIDPPYNTGNDFVYPDDFTDNIKNYQKLTGQIDAEGNKLSANTESSGRFHTDWLNMMYPRLKLARNLLRDDGAIFFSIDEKEIHHLRQIANDVFGEDNFIADITVVTNLKGRNDKAHIASCHEHIVIYEKSFLVSDGLPLTEEQRAAYKYKDEMDRPYALRDLRKRGGPDKREDRPNMFFPIYWHPATKSCSLEQTSPEDAEIFPMRGDGTEGRWRWGREKIQLHLGWLQPKKSERTGRWDIDHRVYLDPSVRIQSAIECTQEEEEDGGDEGLERTAKPKSFWMGGQFSTDSGKRSLKELLPGECFDFPKSVELIRQCVQFVAGLDGIIVDLFAGSGTSGQAVLTQNAADGGNRRYILVQLPEKLDPENKDQKVAAEFCDKLGKPRNIAELTKERLRRAAKKIQEENPLFKGDLGFRVFKLDSTNIREWDPAITNLEAGIQGNIDHLKADRTEDDILCELLLKLGLDLSIPLEHKTIAGKPVYSIGAGTLIACLATEIAEKDVEALAHGIIAWHKALNPAGETTIVFRDSAVANDIAKTNLTAILEQSALSNVRSI